MRFLALSAALLLTAAHPARAQGISVPNIPWGSDTTGTSRELIAAGLTPRIAEGRRGDQVFASHLGFTVHAMFAGNALVSINTIIPAERGVADSAFAAVRGDLLALYGEPVADEAGYVKWEDGETAVALAARNDEQGVYVSLLYMGPGYRAENRRRALADSTLYPVLAPRWNLAYEDTETRIAWDRATVAVQGGMARVWVRTDHAHPVAQPAAHDRVLTQMDFDCPGRRYRSVRAVFRLREQEVRRFDVPEPNPWEFAEPETAGERLLAAVCAGAAGR